MKVICAWCEQEGRIKQIGERGFNDPHTMISHGICEAHEQAMLKKIDSPGHDFKRHPIPLAEVLLYGLVGMVGLGILLYKKHCELRFWFYRTGEQFAIPNSKSRVEGLPVLVGSANVWRRLSDSAN